MARKDGPAIINKMVGKFQSIIDGLDQGINLCSEEIVSNNRTIKTLTSTNNTIGESKDQAVVFKNNLKNMLEKKPDELIKEAIDIDGDGMKDPSENKEDNE